MKSAPVPISRATLFSVAALFLEAAAILAVVIMLWKGPIPDDRCTPPIARADAATCEKIFADAERGIGR